MDLTYITFPGPGGEMRHWWASGVAPRGAEGCGASIAMIIRRVRRHAMIWEPSRHPTTSRTPCRVERGCREAPPCSPPTSPTGDRESPTERKIVGGHDFLAENVFLLKCFGMLLGSPLASGRFLRGSEVFQGLHNHRTTSCATSYHRYWYPAALQPARSRSGGPQVPHSAASGRELYMYA